MLIDDVGLVIASRSRIAAKQSHPPTMIQWLVQSAESNSEITRGVAPLEWLHPIEQVQLAGLRLVKRRREWLLGRWTAKQLLQFCLAHQAQQRLPLNALAIYHDARGVPRLMPEFGCPAEEWAISISHSHNCAFCAALPVRTIGLGADIEHVEPRGWRFVEDYFTPDEVERARAALSEHRDRLVTAIWSAKEAALKALQLGLTVDTRQVSCAIDPWHVTPEEWSEFKIIYAGCDQVLLQGWWRAWNDFVLTIAIT